MYMYSVMTSVTITENRNARTILIELNQFEKGNEFNLEGTDCGEGRKLCSKQKHHLS